MSSDLLCKSLDFHSHRPKELLLLIDRTFVGKTLDFDCANIEHCKLGKERQSLGLLLLGVIFATQRQALPTPIKITGPGVMTAFQSSTKKI